MKKTKKKKVKFKKITLKVTSRQKRSLENYCISRGVTPVRMIKMSIRPLLQNYSSSVPAVPVSPRQLQLFQD
ncbi:MAG: hypothetical protein ACM3N9_01470 [Syntrophothermus sp.]